MNQPKISIVIPVYNVEKYLPYCLDSVSNQALRDIEIICVNDASPDRCGEILREYAARDERMTLIEFEENRGVSTARNAGIDAARGEYLGFVDSDDTVDPDFYEKLYESAQKTNADMIEGGVCLEYGKGEKAFLPRWRWFWSSIFRSAFIKKRKIEFPVGVRGEDSVFLCRVLLNFPKRHNLNDTFYNYRKRPASASYNYTDDTYHSVVLGFDMICDEINLALENNVISGEYGDDIFLSFYSIFCRVAKYRIKNSSMLFAAQKALKYYSQYPRREQIKQKILESDPALYGLLLDGSMEKLTTFFMSGKRSLARELRANLRNCGSDATRAGIKASAEEKPNARSPLVSVIIPCRDGANYLAEAVSGIERQNMPVEIIVVDDGSTDNTASLAASLGCTVVSIPHSGLSAARNVGLKAARGKYILFHDHDDVMTGGALPRLCAELEEDRAVSFVEARLQDFVSPELGAEEKRVLSPRPEPYYGLLTGAALFRREVFELSGGFAEELQTGQVDFLLRVRAKGLKGKRLDFTSAMRRLHSSNMGRTMRQQEKRDYAAALRAKLAQKKRT